jgi:hypothetical protein
VFPLAIHVVDSGGLARDLSVSLNVRPRLAIATTRLHPTAAGRAYVARLGVSGGVRPLTWRIAGGALPRGLRLGRRTGVLAGTPASAARVRVVVGVRDALGAVATGAFVLTVRP